MQNDTHRHAALPWLEIVRGITRFPRREIHAERFLIGSGPSCHLRLGGDVPPICCVIHREHASLWIDALLPEPGLVVNGRRVEGAYLHDGDLVQIGDFEFVIRIPPGVSRQSELPENALVDTRVQPEELEEFDPESLGALSVDELIDRLEADLALLKRERERRRDGMATLLEAIRRVRSDSEAQLPPADRSSATDAPEEDGHSGQHGTAETEAPESRGDVQRGPDRSANEAGEDESMHGRHTQEVGAAPVVAGSEVSEPAEAEVSHTAEPSEAERVGTTVTAAPPLRDETTPEFPQRIGRLAAELRQIALLVEAAEPSRREGADWQRSVTSDGKVPPATTVDRYVAARLNVLAEELETLQAEVLQRRQRRVA